MSGFLELDLNEIPFPPPANVVKAACSGTENLNRYAEPSALGALTTLLARYSGVQEERILAGPGSDLLLREVVLRFASTRKLVMVSPSFLATLQVARHVARALVSIRLSAPEFRLEPHALLEELIEPCLVIIDNPNNPTGRLILDRELVGEILDRPETLLVVDEAYFEFSGRSFADLVADHPNLAVSRTLDKAFSLAGARVGYLIAGSRFVAALPPVTRFMPEPSLQAATEALREPGYMWKNVQTIVKERERLREELRILGAAVFPSSANFLLIRSDTADLAQDLRQAGVLVLDLIDQLGPGYIRVAVGTPQDNDDFLRAYKEVAG